MPTIGIELWKSDGTAAGTVLVKDIYPGIGDSSPYALTAVGNILYFGATDGNNGFELWKSDGTTAGTMLVKEIVAGSGTANPGYLTALGDTLFFQADNKLWKSDGTAEGTVSLAGNVVSSPSLLTAVGNTLFFQAFNGTNGTELWKSDGTDAGTVLVKDINPGSGVSNPEKLTAVGSMLFFEASDGVNGRELWKSDGTAAGTVLVKNIVSGSGTPFLDFPTAVGNTLYFRANNGTNGSELWKSDGTAAGTVLVKDIFAGGNSSFPEHLTAVGNTLYFSAFGGTNGGELWKSDGTVAGTVLVKDIRAGSGSSSPSLLTSVENTLYFQANNGTNGSELWKSDGTAPGTVLVKDIAAGNVSSSLQSPMAVGNTLYFSANDGPYGVELWKSDGTEAGTMSVKDIASGSENASPDFLTAVGDTLYFRADNGPDGMELWKSDGTAPGTSLVKDIVAGVNGSFPEYLTAVGNTVYFSAYDETNGVELWKSDGTAAGTVLVKDINPGHNSSSPEHLTAVGNTLFFVAYDQILGSELWKSDGTVGGTVMVKDISVGNNSYPDNLTAVGNMLYFSANDGTNGVELWKSDGTAAGTVLVKDIYMGSGPSLPSRLTVVGNTLYFSASNGTNISLWKSDGTAAGTVLIKAIAAGGSSSAPYLVTAVGNTLYFQADEGNNGYELWKSDGTTAGTVLIKDIYPSQNNSYPSLLAAVGNTLYFRADNGTDGIELWKSDGTEVGTMLVKDIVAGSGTSSLSHLTSVGNTLYFSATDGTKGAELWKSDGTAAGTVLVKDIVPGSGDSAPTNLKRAGNILYFSALSEGEGRELWAMALFPPSLSVIHATPGPGNNHLIVGGQVHPRGTSTTVTVDYGTTMDVGEGEFVGTFTGESPQSFGITLYPGGLSPETTYYFRITASNEFGSVDSGILSSLSFSANADLSALILSNGILVPDFSSDTTAYAATVTNAANFLTLTPTKSHIGSSLEVRVNGGSYTTVTSGSPTVPLALVVGMNEVDLLVTAEDGTTRKTYTIIVTREKASQDITFANPGPQIIDATINLSASGGGSGNSVIFTAEGPAQIDSSNVLSFTGTGSVTVRANQAGNAGYHAAPEVAHTFTVTTPATVTLGDLNHTYDGTTKTASATTLPAGLTVVIDYGGPAPGSAGSHPVTATISDPSYSGSAIGTLVIAKATQSISFAAPGPSNQLATASVNLSAIGGASENAVTFSATGPAQIDGSNVLSFTGPGSVTVRANQPGNSNYEAAPEVAHTFTVTAVTATIVLSRLRQVADGSAREVLATTDPPGLEVEFTYNGEPIAPTSPGNYAVAATLTDERYEATASGILIVDDPVAMILIEGGQLPALSALGALDVPTYQIARHEVTLSFWNTVRDWAITNGYDLTAIGDGSAGDHPVHSINWYDAIKWCNARTEWENATFGRSLAPAYRIGTAVFKSGAPDPATILLDEETSGYRLPTVKEWEYAARGGASGTGKTYSGSNDPNEVAWHGGNSAGATFDLSSGRGTWPAGHKAANELGLYDLSGNVAEWTHEANPGNPSTRYLLGGSWNAAASECAIGSLNSITPASRLYTVGLRVVRSVSAAMAGALDDDELSWNSGGDAPWFAQTGTSHDTIDAAESGALGQNNESWVETAVTGPGYLRFRWKSASVPDVDVLHFSIGASEAASLSGTVDWQQKTFEIPAGTSVLRWRFTRSSAAIAGTSRIWLDEVVYSLATEPVLTTAPAIEVTETTATLGGEVTNEGGRSVTARGVVYATTTAPTLADSVANAATGGAGGFSVSGMSLAAGTTYHARAYATNAIGTNYGPEIAFTTGESAIFTDGVATFSRSILPGDCQVFHFTMVGPRIVSLSTEVGAALRAELIDSEGNLIASFTGDSDFNLEQLLLAGDYSLHVFREEGGGPAQPFDLTIDASVVAASRPDVGVGTSAAGLQGVGLYAPTSQSVALISVKANAVTGHATFSNRGKLPDVLFGSATGSSALFAVSYFSPAGNITAGLLTGTYTTPEINENTAPIVIRATISPNKKKLTKKKKGKKPRILKKTYLLSLRLSSTFNPSIEDAASIQVRTK